MALGVLLPFTLALMGARVSLRLDTLQRLYIFHMSQFFHPIDFREWFPISQRDMVHILSRGTSIDLILLRKELPLGMLLVDVLLQSNVFLL